MGRPRYAPAQRCEWLVEPLGAESIEAWLVAVELEDGHDFLKETPACPANASAALRCLCAVGPYSWSCPRARIDVHRRHVCAGTARGLATSFIHSPMPRSAATPSCKARVVVVTIAMQVYDGAEERADRLLLWATGSATPTELARSTAPQLLVVFTSDEVASGVPAARPCLRHTVQRGGGAAHTRAARGRRR